MTRARAWRHTGLRTLLWLALAGAVGMVFGLTWQALALAALLALLWQYLQLALLLRTVAGTRWLPPPSGWGAFSELQAQLHRRDREQRARRRRLLALLAAFRRAASALPDATVVLARGDRRILWFNDAATRLLGLQRPRDVGQRITLLLRAPRVQDWLQQSADEPLIDVASPNDESLRLSLRLIDYGEQQSLLVARDISQLTRLEQVRRDFVANVSHELRTPLTVVHGYLDMIEPAEHEEWAPLVLEMRRQTGRMAQLVDDLLMLSRLEAREHTEAERVDMRALLSTLVREAGALSQGRHRIELEDSAQADLDGAPSEIHSAFSNLVGNAVRYTPAGGRIVVRWRFEQAPAAAAAGLVLEVEDSGHGIPAQHLPRITERFYRVSSSRSRETGGTGLGLSIVKHVLQRHQAQLEIDSEPGRGSIFRCRFGPQRTLPRNPPSGPGP